MLKRVFKSKRLRIAPVFVIPIICIATCGLTIFVSYSHLIYPNAKISSFPNVELFFEAGAYGLSSELYFETEDSDAVVIDWYSVHFPNMRFRSFDEKIWISNSYIHLFTFSGTDVYSNHLHPDFPTEIYHVWNIVLFLDT